MSRLSRGNRRSWKPLYDTDLMLGGGHVKGWRLTDGADGAGRRTALSALKTPEAMAEKYGMADAAPLLFAVGDGNHSLATAKACYENLKKVTPPEQWASLPARYALVEVVNLHDDALTFRAHPPGTVPCGRPGSCGTAFQAFYPGAHTGAGEGHTVEVCGQGLDGAVDGSRTPRRSWRWERCRAFLDAYCKRHPEVQVDYIHGDDVARKLGSQPGNLGIPAAAHGQGPAVPHGDGRRRSAPQDLLHGRGAG